MEIIMTQMRKFEQEAVATEIYEKIQETHGSIQEELENTKPLFPSVTMTSSASSGPASLRLFSVPSPARASS